MSEISKEVNTVIWYTAEGAAELFEVSPNQMRRLFRIHVESLGTHLRFAPSKGRTGRKAFISSSGLLILKNVKDTDRGNKSKLSPSAPLQGKKKVVERAIQQNLELGEIKAMMQTILQNQQLVLEKPNQDVKQLAMEMIDDLSKIPITDDQKKILADMCNMIVFQVLGIETGQPYDQYNYGIQSTKLRVAMNGWVGRKTIAKYTHTDYIKAYKYLKKLL